MKLSIEVDCTPDEARAFIGLPDVKPLQAAVLGRVEQQILDAASSMSPDGILKMWFNVLPQASEQYLKTIGTILKASTPG